MKTQIKFSNLFSGLFLAFALLTINTLNAQSFASIDRNPTFGYTGESSAKLYADNNDNNLVHVVSRKEELNTKIQRNIQAMEVMFTAKDGVTIEKKMLLRKYKVVMLDYNMQIDEAASLQKIEKIALDVKALNSKIMSLRTQDTKQLEIDLEFALKPAEIKALLSL
jgi:hypothetical protein